MPIQTHLEVHVLQHGRWSIHAQFDASQKEIAVEEGKMLDSQPGIDAVKVIREVYDPTEGTHRDYVIYKSADAPIHIDEEESHSGGYGGRSDWHDEDDDGGAGDDYGGTFGGDQFDADDDDWGEAPKKKKTKPKKK